MSKIYKAVAYNDCVPGRDWMFTIEQERQHLGKDFIDNAIREAFYQMCEGGINCKYVSIIIGTGTADHDDIDKILKITMDTVESYYSSSIDVDVSYLYHGVHLIRTMNIAK